MKKGFTLVELLVVIAMLLLLVGSVTTAVASAQRRAKVMQATAEAQEMTNAILAYENYGKNFSLDKYAKGTWLDATVDNVGFILGREQSQMGEGGDIPVLFNAAVRKVGKEEGILDPWGRVYRVMIRKTDDIESENQQERQSDKLTTYMAFPNFNRRSAGN